MKLRMLIGLAGVDFSLSPREETDRFDGKEAERLISAGYAEAVKPAAPETGTKPGGRKAVKPAAPETRG